MTGILSEPASGCESRSVGSLPAHGKGAQRVHVHVFVLAPDGAETPAFEYIHRLPALDWLDDRGCSFYLNQSNWCADSLRDTPELAALMEDMPDCPCSVVRRSRVEGVELHPGRWRVEVRDGVIIDAVEIDEGGAR